MSVKGYTGLFGSGKTYAMVHEAYRARRHDPDIRVLTNLPVLNLPGREVEHLRGDAPFPQIIEQLSEFNSGYLLLDEAGVYLPARRWSKMPDTLMDKWQQLRKDGVELRWTCITPGQVVKDLRDITWETAWCSSYVRIPLFGFVSVNWYSYCKVGEKRYFQARNLVKFRKRRAGKLYDSWGKVNTILSNDATGDKRATGSLA